MDIKFLADGFKKQYGIDFDFDLVYAIFKADIANKDERLKFVYTNNFIKSAFRSLTDKKEFIKLYEGGQLGHLSTSRDSMGAGQSDRLRDESEGSGQGDPKKVGRGKRAAD